MEEASMLGQLGAGGFGFVIGWQLYFVNRYRSGGVSLADLATIVTAVGGTAVLALFPAGTELFGAYGVGLFAGFVGYLATLVVFVARSPSFDVDWFLDGRRKSPGPAESTDGATPTAQAMNSREAVPG